MHPDVAQESCVAHSDQDDEQCNDNEDAATRTLRSIVTKDAARGTQTAYEEELEMWSISGKHLASTS